MLNIGGKLRNRLKLNFLQGMVINGYVNVGISTIERRFGLHSAESGIIAGVYDLGSMLAVIPISYFGGRLGSSKPK